MTTSTAPIAPATGTVRLHRVLRSSPDKIYRAFLDADALARWLPPFGFICQVHQFEPHVGGNFKMSFKNFGTGAHIPLVALTSNSSPMNG